MQIVYLTDIHDNFSGVSQVLNSTEADLYILSGDLTYHAFGSDDEALFRFIELQEKIRTLVSDRSDPLATLRYARAAQVGAQNVQLPAAEGTEYIELAERAKAELLRKYQTLAKAIVPTGRKTIVIPGNYDLPLSETAVAPYDLHEKAIEWEGIRFAGYGSAPVFTPGIPEEIAVRFEEYGTGTKLVSRPRDFMLQQKADVFVLHDPAYGTLDKLPRFGHCGSHGLRSAVDKVAPRLVLSGHVHENCGLMKLGQTFFLNPSNFGSVQTMEGEQVGGFFATINLQCVDAGQKFVREVAWKRLIKGKVTDICAVKIDKNYRASEEVFDQAQFSAMGAFLL